MAETPWWLNAPKPAETFEKKYERIAGKEKYGKFLLAQQTIADPFKNSGTPNPDTKKVFGMISVQRERALAMALTKYESVLKDYSHHVSARSDKVDFQSFTSDQGHKLHLNVPVAGVLRVADYLRSQDFEHKYLHGGDPVDGKIFTLYLGSHANAYHLAQTLSEDLKPWLARPAAVEEVEYAPGVAGRFAVRNDKYTQYGAGLRGIPCLDALAEIGTSTKEHLEKAFKLTYGNLAADFGPYFHG